MKPPKDGRPNLELFTNNPDYMLSAFDRDKLISEGTYAIKRLTEWAVYLEKILEEHGVILNNDGTFYMKRISKELDGFKIGEIVNLQYPDEIGGCRDWEWEIVGFNPAPKDHPELGHRVDIRMKGDTHRGIGMPIKYLRKISK